MKLLKKAYMINNAGSDIKSDFYYDYISSFIFGWTKSILLKATQP